MSKREDIVGAKGKGSHEPARSHAMTGARRWASGLVCVALFMIAGCAPLPTPAGGANVPPASSTRVPPPTPPPTPPPSQPRREPARPAVVRDSTPSADAERVLATIPEPLSPSQQGPPPRGTGMVTMPAPASAYDTLRVNRTLTLPAPATAYDTLRVDRTQTVRAPDSAYDTLRVEQSPENETSAVPVPSPTQPLGNNPAGTLTMPDTLTAPPSVAVPTTVTAPPASTATPPATASPATNEPAKPAAVECWRLQIAAPVEEAKAESRRAAAQSLLMAPMVIQLEKGLYKVRTRDCMTRAAAEALKGRAIGSGFTGAFVVNSVAAVPPRTPKPKPHVAPAKHPAAKRVVKKSKR